MPGQGVSSEFCSLLLPGHYRRNEPPDIDVDFEHQRREEVIQYIYEKYGRHRAALTGVVITYRPRSALRDTGKTLGIDLGLIDRLAKSHRWWDSREALGERFSEAGLDPESPLSKQWQELTTTLIGFPRHLSQHPGGFVIARDKLSRLVSIEKGDIRHDQPCRHDRRISD